MTKPEITPTGPAAINAVARDLLWTALDRAISDGSVSWEDYPALSEQDYRRVVACAMELSRSMRLYQSDYDGAYALLASRSGDVS